MGWMEVCSLGWPYRRLSKKVRKVGRIAYQLLMQRARGWLRESHRWLRAPGSIISQGND